MAAEEARDDYDDGNGCAVSVVRLHGSGDARTEPGGPAQGPDLLDLLGAEMSDGVAWTHAPMSIDEDDASKTWTHGEMTLPNAAPRCAGCHFSHDQCETQVATGRLVHQLAKALTSGNYREIEDAVEAYEVWL